MPKPLDLGAIEIHFADHQLRTPYCIRQHGVSLIGRVRELEDTLLLAYDALNHKELPSYCVFALKSIRPLLCDEAVAKLERQSSR